MAILVHGQALIAVGYLPQVRGFPVRGPVVDETRGCAVGAPVRLTGIARPKPAGVNLARPSGRLLIDLFVDEHTRVAGLARHGLAYIGDGQRVRIDAVHCGRKLVARRIVANGSIVPEATAEDILGQDWRGEAGVQPTARSHAWWAAAAAVVVAVAAGGLVGLRRRPRASRRS